MRSSESRKTDKFQVDEKGLKLKIAWTSGDDLGDRAQEILQAEMKHLDADNAQVKLAKNTDDFLNNPNKPIVSCHAYMGARGVSLALQNGADIVLCE